MWLIFSRQERAVKPELFIHLWFSFKEILLFKTQNHLNLANLQWHITCIHVVYISKYKLWAHSGLQTKLKKQTWPLKLHRNPAWPQPCKHAIICKYWACTVLVRCCQHRTSTGPVLETNACSQGTPYRTLQNSILVSSNPTWAHSELRPAEKCLVFNIDFVENWFIIIWSDSFPINLINMKLISQSRFFSGLHKMNGSFNV